MSTQDEYRDYDKTCDSMRWLAAGFGLGLLVGGALGILLAPKSGRETRAQIKGFAVDLGDKAKTVAGDLSEKAKVTYSTASERVKSTATDVSGKVKTVASDLGERMSGVKEAVKEGYKKKIEQLGKGGKSEGAGEDA